ncbi:hypothetical protein KIP69_09370 [Geobacter sulfurreducens]|uniref:hypothetical protein n=1 Tax=Geobacter sulfurreducens TaxID=35554 RepID=UPI001BDD93AC|nr:hypothetical protein [Geobacter sulfurreducens]QVW33814.1 hypothetical protein KIP69_09370 [Geobacter sulfurreducens]
MKRKVMLAVAASVVALMPVMAQAANKLIVKDATGTVDKMVVTDQGWIGIGTNSPSAGLHLVAPFLSTSQVRSHFKGTAANANGGGGFIGLHNNDAATNGGLPRKDDRLGYLYFGSVNTQNGTIPLGSGFAARAEANWSNTSIPSYYVFETAGVGQTALSERMRLTSDGKLGVNTKTPMQQVEVNGGVRIYPVAQDATKDTATPTATAKPTCSASVRGTMWFTPQAVGADTLDICVKDSGGIFTWKAITIAP